MKFLLNHRGLPFQIMYQFRSRELSADIMNLGRIAMVTSSLTCLLVKQYNTNIKKPCNELNTQNNNWNINSASFAANIANTQLNPSSTLTQRPILTCRIWLVRSASSVPDLSVPGRLCVAILNMIVMKRVKLIERMMRTGRRTPKCAESACGKQLQWNRNGRM